MSQSPWTILDLESFLDEEPLAYSIPGNTPGHEVDLNKPHELFHEQTKYHRATSYGQGRRIRAHIEDPTLIAKCALGYHRRTGEPVSLPAPGEVSARLDATLAGRQSARREQLNSRKPIMPKTLSTLLHHSVRTNRRKPIEKVPGLYQDFRPYPSAGALYPCEVYLAVSAVEGVSPGIYRYDSREHELLTCSILPQHGRAINHFGDTETSAYETPPACAILISSVFERSVRKYGPRGYRLAIIEAGHILQNLALLANALGLSGYVSASFYEAEVERLLGIDGVSEGVLAGFILGYAADSANAKTK